jgi:hypothetical protein
MSTKYSKLPNFHVNSALYERAFVKGNISRHTDKSTLIHLLKLIRNTRNKKITAIRQSTNARQKQINKSARQTHYFSLCKVSVFLNPFCNLSCPLESQFLLFLRNKFHNGQYVDNVSYLSNQGFGLL